MQRSRTRSPHPIGTPGLLANTGPLASAAWLATLELYPNHARWFVEISFTAHDAHFQLEIYAEEWGFVFRDADRTSWIRVTDIPFIHGSDDFELLCHVPPLKMIGKLVRHIEHQHRVQLDRRNATIRTSIPDSEPIIRAWTQTL